MSLVDTNAGYSIIQRSPVVTKKCKHDGQCNGPEHTVKKRC